MQAEWAGNSAAGCAPAGHVWAHGMRCVVKGRPPYRPWNAATGSGTEQVYTKSNLYWLTECTTNKGQVNPTGSGKAGLSFFLQSTCYML